MLNALAFKPKFKTQPRLQGATTQNHNETDLGIQFWVTATPTNMVQMQ